MITFQFVDFVYSKIIIWPNFAVSPELSFLYLICPRMCVSFGPREPLKVKQTFFDLIEFT